MNNKMLYCYLNAQRPRVIGFDCFIYFSIQDLKPGVSLVFYLLRYLFTDNNVEVLPYAYPLFTDYCLDELIVTSVRNILSNFPPPVQSRTFPCSVKIVATSYGFISTECHISSIAALCNYSNNTSLPLITHFISNQIAPSQSMTHGVNNTYRMVKLRGTPHCKR